MRHISILIIFLTKPAFIFVLQESLYYEKHHGEMFFEEFSNSDCYYNIHSKDDSLTPWYEVNIPDDSIFFIETSCNGRLNNRQACSIESAAKAHPNKQIHVLFISPIKEEVMKSQPFQALLQYRNIKFLRILLDRFTQGSPVHGLTDIHLYRHDKFIIHHTSDLLRFLTLYKFGGIYLDLDVIVVKPLDTLPEPKNWVGRETSSLIAVGLLALSKDGIGRNISTEFLLATARSFIPDVWNLNGIVTFKGILFKLCDVKTDKELAKFNTCKGFRIYEPHYFYPLPPLDVDNYLRPVIGSLEELDLTGKYAFHFYNHMFYKVKIPEGTVFDELTKQFCPVVREAAGNIE